MGNTPNEFKSGINCAICTPSLFEPDKTPLYLAIQFTGIEKLIDWVPDPPNDHRFVLLGTDSCFWVLGAYYETHPFMIWIELENPEHPTWVRAKWLQPPDIYFFDFLSETPCIITGNSRLPVPGDPTRDKYSGGSMRINWGSAINKTAFEEQ